MKRIVSALISAVCAVSGWGRIPASLLPTEKEKTAMAREADDFIDAINDGRQDRQADAILHAMRGQGGELAALRQSRNTPAKVSDNVTTQTIQGTGAARGVAMKLFRPKKATGKKLPLLVYFHGGGWTIGSINSCSRFCDALAATGKVMVLAVDYALAPEKPYPAGLMDCVAATEFAMANAVKWGSAPSLVSLGGDSSGGNLAISTAMYLDGGAGKAGAKGVVKPKSLVLFYPVVKAYADNSASWKRYKRGYGLDRRLMETFNEAYLGGGDSKDPLVSPSEASAAKLSKLPPILLVAAEKDILADQGKDFTAKVKGAQRIELPGTVHLFITVPGQETAFRKAVAVTSEFLK